MEFRSLIESLLFVFAIALYESVVRPYLGRIAKQDETRILESVLPFADAIYEQIDHYAPSWLIEKTGSEIVGELASIIRRKAFIGEKESAIAANLLLDMYDIRKNADRLNQSLEESESSIQ